MLCEESHHIVRMEAATLVAIIYDSHELSAKNLVKFYNIMSYTVAEDSQSNVRRGALKFWKNVIDFHLLTQGMIDGEFPEVTFSKDSRKIVVLSYSEVKNRVVKVLHQLSETGCLSAIKMTLEDCDNEVRLTATDIVNDLYDLIKKYRIQIFDIENFDVASLEDYSSTFTILEKEINCKFKKRSIFSPDKFVAYVINYFKPKRNDAETSQKTLINTIIKEILCGNSKELT